MKRMLLLTLALFAILTVFPNYVNAETYDDLSREIGAESLIEELPDDSKKILEGIGVTGVDYAQLNEITFQDLVDEILAVAGNESSTPLKITTSVIAIMLLYSILYGMKTSVKTSSMQQVLSVCVTLCITCVIVLPVCEIITSGIEVIKIASDFMLAYIPVMLVIMTANGHAVSGASYYSMMIFAGQGVSQVSSHIIAPFLKIFLGLSVTSAVSPNVNLKGFIDMAGKITKWLLGFVMTLFTALLTFRQLITTAMDNVSTRAVRFTLTSLVPVVGSALSDAYKTVQSSVNLLKSGVGVFVIISVAIVFLPCIIQCLFWLLSLGLCKSVAEVLDLKEPCMILSAVSTVITTIFAILLCIMSVFIISTALVLLLGGGGA